jgi:hypothetical protein
MPNWVVYWGLVGTALLYVGGLIVICAYYEIRRSRRIARGLPLENTAGPGFEVSLFPPGSETESRKSRNDPVKGPSAQSDALQESTVTAPR